MARKRRECKRAIIIYNPEDKVRRNPETGHEWHKCKEIIACLQGDDYYVCKKICKKFK